MGVPSKLSHLTNSHQTLWNERAGSETQLPLAAMEKYSLIWTAKIDSWPVGMNTWVKEGIISSNVLQLGREEQWRVTVGHMMAKTAKINKSLLVIGKEMLYLYICHFS